MIGKTLIDVDAPVVVLHFAVHMHLGMWMYEQYSP
jgi:hypothetical protein